MRFCPSCGSRFEQEQVCPNDGAATEPLPEEPDTDPLVGTVVDGRYRVEGQLGEGGMGVVYAASHTTLKKKLALKVLRGEMSKDREVVQRFIQEAQAATSIGHENIIDISDFGRLSDGTAYFVMEFLDGMELTELIQRGGSVPVAEAAHIVRQIASALGAAHKRGIIHRDMKPDNVFLVKRGGEHFVKVLDFGIAKVGGASNKLTQTGMVFGTPHYMSPEQAAGQSVDNRTDIYALGVIMYEMLTGHVPFDADTFMGVLTKHMFEEPAPMTTGGRALGAIEDITMRALAKKPEDRYQDMEALVADLDRVMTGGAVQASGGTGGSGQSLADELEPRTRTEMRLSQVVSPAAGRRRLVALAGAGAGLVALLAGVSFLAFSGDDGGGPQAVPTPPPVPAAPPLPAPPAGGPAAPPTEPAQGTSPQPAVVNVVSVPAGAQLVIDGAIVGQAPAPLPRPEQGSRSVELRLAGYAPEVIELTPESGPDLTVQLTRRARRTSRTRSRTTTPADRPRRRRARVRSEVVDPWAD